MTDTDVSTVDKNGVDWYRLDAAEATGRLEVDPQRGLK